MPIHADKEGFKAIHWFKKKLLKPLLNRVHRKYRKELEKRVEDGWKRSSTPEIKRHLDELLQGFDESNSVKKAADIFLVVYDSDNAYADLLHRFVERCNNQELVLEQGRDYLNYSRGDLEWLESEWQQRSQMDEEERKYIESKIKSSVGREKYREVKEEVGDPLENKEKLNEFKRELT